MRQLGFTLVEMLVAVLVVAIFMAVSIPQYNELLKRREFDDTVQRQLADCIAKAQADAASLVEVPGSLNNTRLRWTAAKISDDGCTVEYFGADNSKFANLASLSTLADSVPATASLSKNFLTAPAEVERYSVGGTTYGIGSSSLRLFFGVAEHGVPVLAVAGGSAKLTPPQPGSGFWTGIEVSDGIRTSLVTVERLGTPIKVEKRKL